jgi:hypothetical protein
MGHGSDIFEDEEWNQEESDHLESNDIPEGTLSTLKGHTHNVNCAHSNAASGQAPQVGESCALGDSVVIKVFREIQEVWRQSQDPGSTAEHVIASL